MDKEAARKAIQLLQAYVSGQQIEYRIHGSLMGWNETDELQGNFSDRDYRIKPKTPLIGSFWPPAENAPSFRGIELTDEVTEALKKARIPYADK